jgi:acyl-[acyl-carrier-protein]-phospholipid O-acyltransferase/long-chain-fatty-acid--[acyl-carrier-protein] ligase
MNLLPESCFVPGSLEVGDGMTPLVLSRQFIRMCRRNLWRQKIADSSGAALSGGGLLARTLAVRSVLRRDVLAPGEEHVGILLPPSVAAVLMNTALTVDRRVPVNLNYTASSNVLNASIAQCGIRHVLTSRRMLERFPLKLDAEMVFAEELKQRMRWTDKLAAAAAWLLPAAALERWLALAEVRLDDTATIMFTSGSTGEPKGVVLTHANIASNLAGINDLIHISRHDVLLGVLPIFHCYGYTATLWTALTLDALAVYHFTPLEPRQIGALCRKHGGTLLIATPTFLRSYLRRCEPEDFRTLDVVFAGAEKLPPELATSFQARFGVLPVEGYGTTELSPVVAGNQPPTRDPSPDKSGNRPGTIGRPLKGVDVKVIDLDSGADLPHGQHGLLLVRGPNVMKGYLNRPDLTAEVMRGDWYVTGDVASIDPEGFITITGRTSRFSKIGGEMVPHIGVEAALHKILGGEDIEAHLAVTAVSDDSRGERLVVLHTGLRLSPPEICRAMVAGGVPPLWIPSPDSYRQVAAIPLLGTGKLDLTELKKLAMKEFTAREN